MIRINLLTVERRKVKKKASFQIAQKLVLVCSVILAITAGGLVWWYFYLTHASDRLDRDIENATRETQRLHSVISQVQQFELRKAQLQQRVTLIEQLRKGQDGPVHMIDELSRALPDMVWLLEVKQVANDLTIDGRCTTMTALSDFVSNLATSRYFKKQVEIVNSQVESSTVPGASTTELIKFTVRAQLATPGS